MGAVTTPALAAAVAGEGGLGMNAAAGLTADEVDAQVRAALDLAGDRARVGVNFLIPFLDHQAHQAASRVAVLVECFYGDPDPAIGASIHNGGALAAWQVGSRHEAFAAVEARCDVLVLQGPRGGRARPRHRAAAVVVAGRPDHGGGAAGGRRRSRIRPPLRPRWPRAADGVRIGARLVATVEADVHPDSRPRRRRRCGRHGPRRGVCPGLARCPPISCAWPSRCTSRSISSSSVG